MGGKQDKRRGPRKGNKEQERLGRPGKDLMHPGHPSPEPGMDASSPRREDDQQRDAEDLRDEEL
ncbi:hypothetical protein [Streptomyces sp. CB00455]|uniref:hypothetical protein n=1 Tax=Streptomyces sp. CB00455 TaxID=1703927 RepID=UPI001F5BD08E|nr:hypothetical protein [Streptomyces sp. CB00455]